MQQAEPTSSKRLDWSDGPGWLALLLGLAQWGADLTIDSKWDPARPTLRVVGAACFVIGLGWLLLNKLGGRAWVSRTVGRYWQTHDVRRTALPARPFRVLYWATSRTAFTAASTWYAWVVVGLLVVAGGGLYVVYRLHPPNHPVSEFIRDHLFSTLMSLWIAAGALAFSALIAYLKFGKSLHIETLRSIVFDVFVKYAEERTIEGLWATTATRARGRVAVSSITGTELFDIKVGNRPLLPYLTTKAEVTAIHILITDPLSAFAKRRNRVLHCAFCHYYVIPLVRSLLYRETCPKPERIVIRLMRQRPLYHLLDTGGEVVVQVVARLRHMRDDRPIRVFSVNMPDSNGTTMGRNLQDEGNNTVFGKIRRGFVGEWNGAHGVGALHTWDVHDLERLARVSGVSASDIDACGRDTSRLTERLCRELGLDDEYNRAYSTDVPNTPTN